MHSFAPSLSFLLSFLLLNYLPLFPTVLAADLHSARDSTSLSQLDAAARTEPSESDLAARQASGHSIASLHRRHAALSNALNARSAHNQSDTFEHSLYPGKRAAGASFTNFVTGLGACGGTNVASDFVVALNKEQWENGAHCGAAITITINGKTVGATIVDRCIGCGFGNIDLTDGLFEVWAPLGKGTLSGDWEYGSGAPAKSSAAPKPSSSTSKPTPSSTSTSASASSSANSSTAQSSTSASASASATTSSSVITSTPVPTDVGNLEQMVLALVGMGGIAMAALPTRS